MTTILVSHLNKTYKIFKRSPGLLPTLQSLFYRPGEDVKAVNDISFKIEEGELVGFIGPNGAGKTTTLKCLAGLLYPTTGKISVLGFTPFERKDKFLKEISLIMGQKNQLWWDLPAVETFRLNKEIYDIPETRYNHTLKELSRLLAVEDLMTVPVRRLSLGERMKMELIASLIHKPKVLFLDEPTIGLDVVMQKKMRDFISEYNKLYKATILLTSHYMSDVKSLCKRIIIINHGKIIYDGSLAQFISDRADTKIIKVTFGQVVDKKRIIQFRQIIKFDYPNLILNVPKKEANKIAVNLISNFPIEDLNIEDPEIDDIIRNYFTKNRS